MGIYIIITVLFVIAFIVLLEIRKETHEFTVVNYQFKTEKLDKMEKPLKIAFLSDLHNHVYGEKNKDLLDAIRAGNPDYILIGGDMLVGRRKKYDFEEAKEFVKQLPGIAPVYYANGNHEERMHLLPEYYGDSYDEYKHYLEDNKIVWLENDKVTLDWGNRKIVVHGVELPLECYSRKENYWLQKEDIINQIGEPEKENYNILMAHHPSFAKIYDSWGTDLTLSGHMHGGVARLPIFGGVGVISPQFGIFPQYSGGCYELENSKLVVSKGLGTHTIHVRFWNPAELIFLEIRGER